MISSPFVYLPNDLLIKISHHLDFETALNFIEVLYVTKTKIEINLDILIDG